MKIIIFFLIFTGINLFSYDFSNDLPQNTLFYLTVKDFNSLSDKFSRTSTGKFYKSSKNIKSIEKNLKKLASLLVYNEEQDMSKIEHFTDNLKRLTHNPFSLSIGLSKFFKPQYAFLVKGKELDKIFETLYRDILKDEFKKGNINIRKKIYKGVKVNILDIKREVKVRKNIYKNYKQNTKKENMTIVYAIVNNELIVSDSVEYLNLIISTVKNKNMPRLSGNSVFKRSYLKYKKSDFYMFFDLKTVLKLMASDKGAKKVIDNYSLDKLESLISYFSFNNGDYSIFMKLISKNTLPVIIKDVLFKNSVIKVPEFIPDTCYSFNALSIDFSRFFDLALKFQSEREIRGLRKFESQIGISFKELLDSLGKTIYYLSFFRENKSSSILLFTFTKPKFLLKLIMALGSNPMVGMSTQDYLDGKIITASGSFTMIGYALGYKNNNFIFGETKIVKEIMQKMSGNSGSFYNTKFYKALSSRLSDRQSSISFTNSPVSNVAIIKDFQKTFKKEYRMGSDKKEMKMLKTLKSVVDSFAEYSIEDFAKYFDYSLAKTYVEKNELILEIK